MSPRHALATVKEQTLAKARRRLELLEAQATRGLFVAPSKLMSARELIALLEGKRA